jgi:DNA-binding IclR family transcriptional regulator
MAMASGEKKDSKKDGAQSIHRAMAVIRTVAKYNHQGVNFSRIAREIDLTPSTTHRIINVLVEEGVLCHNAVTRLYHLGIGLYLLGSEARQYHLRDVYRNALNHIAQQTGDTVFLVMQSGYDVLCVDRVVGQTPIQILAFNTGDRRPLGVGAGSLAILASLPDDEIDRIIRHNERRYASFSGYTRTDLDRMIRECRANGYVVNTVTPYTIGVGVCLTDDTGTIVGAVSVSGIISKMDEERPKQIAMLIKSQIG